MEMRASGCGGRGGCVRRSGHARGEAGSAALEHRPSAEDVPGADMSGAGASPRRDGSAADRRPGCQGGDGARRVKGCMDCAPKGKGRDGQRADCRVDGRQGRAGAALWAGTATAGQPTSDSRCPWAGRRAACRAPRVRRGSLAAATARRARLHQAARAPRVRRGSRPASLAAQGRRGPHGMHAERGAGYTSRTGHARVKGGRQGD